MGVYPEVSLKAAREARDAARKQLAEGQDPAAIKQQAKRHLQLKIENNFKSAALAWHTKQKEGWAENTARNNMTRLESDVFPHIGAMPLEDIKPLDIVHMLQAIEARGVNDIPRRAFQICRKIFSYAVVMELCPENPCAHIEVEDVLKKYEKGHFASIDPKELPAFLHVLRSNASRSFPATLYATQLMMLTFVRTRELIETVWDEFDFEGKQWIIPAKRMKMPRDHIIPLSNQAVEILEKLQQLNGHSRYVFASKRDPRNHISNNTILAMLRRMGYAGIMTGHGFRSLAMTVIKEKLGYRHEVPDRQLAHAQNSIDAAYDRATFLDERTKMMQDWADYLDSVGRI